MTRRALLVGSNFSAVPLLLALKRRGFHVSVCGNRPDEPCHFHADASCDVDYSDREKLLDLVSTGGFDAVIPSGNDVAYMSATYVAQVLGLPGYDPLETATVLHNKRAFRAFTDRHDIPAPRSIMLREDGAAELGALRYPLLVKPADNFSGRGVIKVTSDGDIADAIAEARNSSRSADVIVEEFIEGSLHSHSAFIKDQKIVFDVFVDEYCTVYPYQVDSSHHPSLLSRGACRKMQEAMTRVVKLLGLNDGLLHTQFLSRGDDIWVVECMRRSPGDLYGSLVDQSLGIDYADLVVSLALGENFVVKPRFDPPRLVGRHTISTDRPSVPLSFSHTIPAEAVRIAQLKVTGKPLSVAPMDKLAILFADFSTQEQMRDIAPRFKDFISLHSFSGDAA